MLLGAAVALFLLWVGVLIAMAVYSAKRPAERHRAAGACLVAWRSG